MAGGDSDQLFHPVQTARPVCISAIGRTLHWVIEGIEPPELVAAREEEEFREARQRERFWYVATTRARDFLVIPDLPGASARSWSRVMNLGQRQLPRIQVELLPEPSSRPPPPGKNEQTELIFARERERVSAASPTLIWDRPSERDEDRGTALLDPFVIDAASEGPRIVRGAGSLRGTILHKLMEELLTGELLPSEDEALPRASELLAQLVTAPENLDAILPVAGEMAGTALRTYKLPELAPFLHSLIPEVPLWAANSPHYFAGRVDAAAIDGDRVSLVVDWKSDINPTPSAHRTHAAQLRDYLRVTGASRGALVYMSAGRVIWVDAV